MFTWQIILENAGGAKQLKLRSLKWGVEMELFFQM